VKKYLLSLNAELSIREVDQGKVKKHFYSDEIFTKFVELLTIVLRAYSATEKGANLEEIFETLLDKAHYHATHDLKPPAPAIAETILSIFPATPEGLKTFSAIVTTLASALPTWGLKMSLNSKEFFFDWSKFDNANAQSQRRQQLVEVARHFRHGIFSYVPNLRNPNSGPPRMVPASNSPVSEFGGLQTVHRWNNPKPAHATRLPQTLSFGRNASTSLGLPDLTDVLGPTFMGIDLRNHDIPTAFPRFDVFHQPSVGHHSQNHTVAPKPQSASIGHTVIEIEDD